MSDLFTYGRWVVKDGMEGDFIERWDDLADWTAEHVEGSSWAMLLQDREDPRVFMSFGPWESLEAIEAWRGVDGFQDRVGMLQELLASFEALTMQTVASSGIRP